MPPHSQEDNLPSSYDEREGSISLNSKGMLVSASLTNLRDRQAILLRPRRDSFLDSSSSSPSKNASCQVLRSCPKGSDASLIRSRLLNRLGISKECDVQLVAAALAGRMDSSSNTLRRGRCQSFKEALKADYGKPDKDLAKAAAASQSKVTSPGKKCAVSFDTSVQVHTIPARVDYSKRMRCALWTHPMEMQQNAARNSLEFAAEGWDWRQVADDEDMVIYAGERIHPIHFVQECNLNRHFCSVLAQQQQQQQPN
jgi:hypothetical protein